MVIWYVVVVFGGSSHTGYCLYGGQTILVVTTGHGVNGFTLDTTSGEFILTHPKMRIPPRGSVYSFNEGNSHTWDPRVTNYLNTIKKGKGESGHRYDGIYIGALVADIHNVMTKGKKGRQEGWGGGGEYTTG